jgi:hypothetical protein
VNRGKRSPLIIACLRCLPSAFPMKVAVKYDGGPSREEAEAKAAAEVWSDLPTFLDRRASK